MIYILDKNYHYPKRMDIFDKTLTLTPFKKFLAKYSTTINRYIETSQPFLIVGAYGLGKGILCGYIQNLPRSKYKIAYVDLELFIDITPAKIFGAIIHSTQNDSLSHSKPPDATEDDFYWKMSEVLKKLKQKKLIILLRHAGKLSHIEPKVITRLNNFLYDNYEKVILIGSSSPKLINFPVEELSSLFGNNYLYVARLDDQTAVNDVRLQEKIYKTKFTKYKNKIIKLSHNVHGTIVLLCSMLAKYKPKDLNEHFIYQTVYANPKLKLFFDVCFN